MKLIANSDLKKYILENYDQVTIFATYLEIPETDINYCLENKSNAISNPLRVDRDPSLSFMYIIDNQTGFNKIKMHDWADMYYRGDCFDLVGIIRKLRSKNSIEFIAICKDIISTMETKTLHNSYNINITPTEEKFTNIHIEPRLWNQHDINLWNSFGLPFNEIKHIIFPLKKSFISNFNDYKYNEEDPCYAWISGYYDGKTLYNLYFPFRSGKERHKPRFKTNNKFYQLQCIHELKPADILVITKANKERLLIKRLLHKISKNHTIEVTTPTSESVILTDSFVLKLYDIYSIIVTNFDFDYAGLKSSGEHKRKYGMIRFIPTNGRYGTYNFGGKDLCEIYANRGEQYCIDLLQESYNYLKQQIDKENEKFIS